MTAATIALWNIAWCRKDSDRASTIRASIAEYHPDVVCLAESKIDFLPEGHVVAAQPDYGYPLKAGRRKVLLWSHHPWTDVDCAEASNLPSGRYVRATTQTPAGPINFVGMCIPWSHAHVTSGRQDRSPWEDHRIYLEALPQLLASLSGPSVGLGDFNQTQPRSRAPADLNTSLFETALAGFDLVTGGIQNEHRLIDHIALTPDLSADCPIILQRRNSTGKMLSDHYGVVTKIRRV